MTMANLLTEQPAVLDRVCFSDKAHFWLDGQVNSWNAAHWESGTPGKMLNC